MNQARHFALRLGIAGLAVCLLCGCNASEAFGSRTSSEETASAHSHQGTAGSQRDVEAPDVFAASEPGLWDGRPSLGGIWVAYPNVKQPERVIIRNTGTGKFAVGALIRRSSGLPGPSLQVSSDAATALGMEAGAEAELSVVALRREETSAQSSEHQQTGTATAEASNTSSVIPAAGASLGRVEGNTEPSSPSTLDKPYLQVGIFSIEANATRTAAQMRTAGMASLIRRETINEKPFWRVVVGPANTGSERSMLLATIKSEGFTDAYPVSN